MGRRRARAAHGQCHSKWLVCGELLCGTLCTLFRQPGEGLGEFLGVKTLFLLNFLFQRIQIGRVLVCKGGGWLGPALCCWGQLGGTGDRVLLHRSLGLCRGLGWVGSSTEEPDQLLLRSGITLRTGTCPTPLTPAPALPAAAAGQLMIS